jgi:hypothetical protein
MSTDDRTGGDPARRVRLRAGGDREVYIVIEPERVSGRRVRAW